jgi:hypothetical protein
MNLLDLLLLVAGCGAGLALGLHDIASGAYRYYDWGSEGLALAEAWGAALGLSVTMTTLVLRLRPPRPAWCRLRRQPGFIAGLVTIAAAVEMVLRGVVTYGKAGLGSPLFRNNVLATVLSPIEYGFFILIGWGTLKVSGAWVSEAGAIDRLGRAMGWFWIAAFVALTAAHRWVQGP